MYRFAVMLPYNPSGCLPVLLMAKLVIRLRELLRFEDASVEKLLKECCPLPRIFVIDDDSMVSKGACP